MSLVPSAFDNHKKKIMSTSLHLSIFGANFAWLRMLKVVHRFARANVRPFFGLQKGF